MKIAKSFFTIALIIVTLLIIGVTATYLFISDTTLMALAVKEIESATGVEIDYQKDAQITRTLWPVLSINDFILKDDDNHFSVQSSSLKLQISLPGLLFGKLNIPLLALGDTRVELIESDAVKEQKTFEPLPLIPVFGDIQISQLSVVDDNNEFNLSALNIKEFKIIINPDEIDKLVCTLQSEFSGNTLDIKVTLPNLKNIIQSQNLPFSIEMKNDVSHLSTEGLIDFSSTPPAITAGVQANTTVVPTFLSDTLDPVKHINISTQISGNYQHVNLRECRLNAKTINELDLNITGQLDLIISDSGLNPDNVDLSLMFSGPNTHAARWLLFDDVPEFGAIDGQVKILSKKGDLSLEKIVVKTRDKDGIQVDLNGRIQSFPLEADISSSGYHLDVIMTSARTSVMGERLGLDIPVEEPLKISYTIEGEPQALQFNNIDLSIEGKNRDHAKASGEILFGNWSQPDPMESIKLAVEVTTGDTKTLEPIIGKKLPELGPIKAQALIRTVSQTHRVDDINVQIGQTDPLLINVTGSADQITFFPGSSLKGIQLSATASGDDTAGLTGLFSLEKAIPPIGRFKASSKIIVNDQAMQLNNINLTAGKKEGNQIHATGNIRLTSQDGADPVESIDLAVEVKSKNTRALEPVVGKELPELGSITAKARIHTVSQTHRIDDIQVLVGKTKPVSMTVTGSVDQIVFFPESRLDGIHFLATASGKDTADLSGLFSLKTTLPSMGSYQASAKIFGNSQKLGASELSFISDLKDNDNSLMHLDIKGQFDDFSKIDSLKLNTRLNARNLKTIGSLFDQKWPVIGPVTLDSSITKESDLLKLNTTIAVENIQIKATNTVFFSADPPRITGDIQANNFYFPDLADLETKNINEKQDSTYFFSRTPINIDWLGKMDIDLSVDIKSFEQDRSRFESAYFKVDLESSHLSVRPARLKFPKGTIDWDLTFNLQDELKLNLKAIGKEISPYQTFSTSQTQIKERFDADIDIDVDIASSGVSYHELASNMEGDIYSIVKNGKLRRELLDLLFIDLIGWTYNKARGGKYIHINCGVIDYKIKQGVVTTNAFFLDGSDITIAGEGTVDLAKEEIHYVFLPKKKSNLITGAEPVKITGSLSDPSISVMPWKSAAASYGSLIFSPYLFAGQVVFGWVRGALKRKPAESPCDEYERVQNEQESENNQ